MPVGSSGDGYTAGGRTLTELILLVFRVNGELLAAGDRLTRPLNLTSARWQVLGAIALAPQPRSVADLARSMGLSRQAVQRTANELHAEGLVAWTPNPAHRRAQLVTFTRQGELTYEATLRRQTPWANEVAVAFRPRDLGTTVRVLRALCSQVGTLPPTSVGRGSP